MRAASLAQGSTDNRIKVKTTVNTHTHGIYLLHSVDEIKKVTGMQSQKVKNILRRMFSKGKKKKYKLIELENSDFYAFVINNVKQLKIDFKKVTSQMGGTQLSLKLEPKVTQFCIPEMEVYKFSEVKHRTLMRMNAYREYTNEFVTDKTRSLPERLFERYCENNDKVEWVYKKWGYRTAVFVYCVYGWDIETVVVLSGLYRSLKRWNGLDYRNKRWRKFGT